MTTEKESWGEQVEKREEAIDKEMMASEYGQYTFNDPIRKKLVDDFIRKSLHDMEKFTCIPGRGVNIDDIRRRAIEDEIKVSAGYYTNWCEIEMSNPNSLYNITDVYDDDREKSLIYVMVKDVKNLSEKAQISYAELNKRKHISWTTQPFVWVLMKKTVYEAVERSGRLDKVGNKHIFLQRKPVIDKNTIRFVADYMVKLQTKAMADDDILIYADRFGNLYTDGINDTGSIPNINKYKTAYEDPKDLAIIKEKRLCKDIPGKFTRPIAVADLESIDKWDKELFGDKFDRKIHWTQNEIHDLQERMSQNRPRYVN